MKYKVCKIIDGVEVVLFSSKKWEAVRVVKRNPDKQYYIRQSKNGYNSILSV